MHESAVGTIKKQVALAQEQGGRVICHGKQPDGIGRNYFEPTIIECPSQYLNIVDTE